MSWQVDVFGKITAKTRQEKSRLNATRAQYAAAMVTLCGQIASAYLNLRTLQAQLDVANEHIRQQQRVADLVKARFEAGVASKLDVNNSLTVLYSTQATLPAIDTQIRAAINSIAILTGVYPDEISPMLFAPAPLPEYKQIVAAGVPMELLRRRPDIVEAEYNLAAAAAGVGIAKKDFLPTLSIEGAIGTSAHGADRLFSNHSFTYSIAPTLSWTVFDGLARRSALRSAREQMEIEIDSYNMAVMTAVQETDNAMTAYFNTLRQIEMLEKVVGQTAQAVERSVDLYTQGLSSFTPVADALMNHLEYTNSLVAARGNALGDLIDIYEALGGGWNGN